MVAIFKAKISNTGLYLDEKNGNHSSCGKTNPKNIQNASYPYIILNMLNDVKINTKVFAHWR